MRILLVAVATFIAVEAAHAVLAEENYSVAPVLKSFTTITGQTIQYPAGKPEISSVLIELPPGKESGRHTHPVPTYVHILTGTLTVEFDDGVRQTFDAGQGFLEAVNTWHNGKNPGQTPVTFLVIFAGEQGKPNMIRPDKMNERVR